ncbi:MAG: hypothetical protein EOP24_37520 [Hyphomicrobiales bacterium]|nr:MAG: hypothetical protein EOP24_37520 [Hyphomicrobiales bacterium]
MCFVIDCAEPDAMPYKLRETEGFELPANVVVCEGHGQQLQAGVEFRLDQARHALYIGEGVRKSGKIYLREVAGLRAEALVVTNREDEEGQILKLRVRQAGNDEIQDLELEANREVMESLHHWVGLALGYSD